MAITASRRRSSYAGPACPWCDRPIAHERFRDGVTLCPSCSKAFEAVRFDPLEPRAAAVADVAAAAPGENIPCAKHARNKAVAACARCGQFMCELCRIDADGKIYCPGCYERLTAEAALASGVTRIKNYPGMASALLLFGLLFSFGGLPIGIGAAYYCIRGLADDKARQEGWKVGLIVRLVLSFVVMGIGTLVLVALFGGFD